MATINSIDSTINAGAGVVKSSNVGVLTSTATTNHAVQVGNASGTLTSLAVGATNQALLGNTGADPSWGTIPAAALASNSFAFAAASSGLGAPLNTLFNFTSSPVTLGNSITIDMNGMGVYWTATFTSASPFPVPSMGLFAQYAGGGRTIKLPSTSSVGDTLYIITHTTGGSATFTITQVAGQQIFINTTNTTLGAGGSLATASNSNASLTLVCRTANTTWWAFDIMGTWTPT